jgi:single-stranded DNA-specific DHH superfamily exonuclease
MTFSQPAQSKVAVRIKETERRRAKLLRGMVGNVCKGSGRSNNATFSLKTSLAF